MAENRVEKINRFEIHLKMTPFWLSFIPPCTGPDPTHTKTIPNSFFFLAENGYTRGTHAAVPRQYPYPQGTRYGYGGVFAVSVLPWLRTMVE